MDVLARPLLGVLAVLACSACGPTSVIEGRIAWDGPSFGVDYIAPPWELESESPTELRLRIGAEVFGVELEGSPPTHVLVVGVVDGPTSILDLLPVDARPGDTTGVGQWLDTTGDLPDTTGELPSSDELPDGWQDIDLNDPTEVALVELDHLVTAEKADLVHEIRPFTTGQGVQAMEYEVVVAPGLFVRAFYLPAQAGTVRALFASLFDLVDGDVDAMASTLRTDAIGER